MCGQLVEKKRGSVDLALGRCARARCCCGGSEPWAVLGQRHPSWLLVPQLVRVCPPEGSSRLRQARKAKSEKEPRHSLLYGGRRPRQRQVRAPRRHRRAARPPVTRVSVGGAAARRAASRSTRGPGEQQPDTCVWAAPAPWLRRGIRACRGKVEGQQHALF